MSSLELRRPSPLRPGDAVALVSPSSPVDTARLARGVELLQSWGLSVTIGGHATAAAHRGILAGTDEERAVDFTNAWRDPTVRAVFCTRGGYGATRLLDIIDWDDLASAEPTWLVGSSDVTALHAVVTQRLGLMAIHGPMPASQLLAGDEPDARSIASLQHALFGSARSTMHSTRHDPINPATVQGRLVGGNLTLVTSLLATPYALAAKDSIVFLEEVEEAPYRIDRLLTQLLSAGWFDGVRGVALGDFTNCGPADDVTAVVIDRLRALGVPVVFGFTAGHGRPQESLVLGSVATLDAAAGTLSF